MILFQTLKDYQTKEQKIKDENNKVLLENFLDKTIDKFIKLLTSENLISLNKELKENKFTNKIKLEIYFDLVFDSKDKLISLETLSNGEQVILLGILWDYLIAKNKKDTESINTISKNVLLLDEPDAHMHPSAIYKLVESVKNYVKQFKVQVIMTTQNPITLKFFDYENIYILNYNNEHFKKWK